MHTVFSDGTVWPTVRVTEAWEEGLDAMAELLEDRKLRADIGRKGIRRIMEGHIYEDRIKNVLDTIGITYNEADDSIAAWSLVTNKVYRVINTPP